MSVASESASHSTLLTAFSKVDLQSDNLEAQRSNTPFPSGRLSDETINVLVAANQILSANPPKPQRQKGNKRSRNEQPGTSREPVPERSDYPAESKPIYLRLKNSHRKKIALASQISKMHSELLKNIYPPSVEFKFNVNKSRSDGVQKAWSTIINECKQKLTKVLLHDMFSKYSQVKDNISKDFLLLEDILTPTQLKEIKDSLQNRCTNIAPMYTLKAKRQYETKRPNQEQQTKRRKVVPQRRKTESLSYRNS